MLTSNLEFSRWGEVFGDDTMTSALLDRLTHHAHIFALVGESYRFKQAKAAASRSAPRGRAEWRSRGPLLYRYPLPYRL